MLNLYITPHLMVCSFLIILKQVQHNRFLVARHILFVIKHALRTQRTKSLVLSNNPKNILITPTLSINTN